MKSILAIVLLSLFVCNNSGQTGTGPAVRGRIVNQIGEGVAGKLVLVYVSPMVYSAFTAADGSFIIHSISTGISSSISPADYYISNNYPNPFNPGTRIDVTLPLSGRVKIEMFNALGQSVGEDVDRVLPAGRNSIDLELNGYSNGIYFARISINDKYAATRKLMLLYGSQHLKAKNVDTDIRLNKAAVIKIDSLVVNAGLAGRVVFRNLPDITGSLLDVGNLTVNILPAYMVKAFQRNKAIGKGINFGNALEAPNEGEWGLTIKESYVQAIAEAGFNSVRIPICWSAHTKTIYPYVIDPKFLQRVDEVVDWCLKRNLTAIITIHHFNDLYLYPDSSNLKEMFYSIWKQLTAHYIKVDSEHLFFELLNEPNTNLSADKWNVLMPQVMDSVRSEDKERTLIIDVPDYAYHGSISKLKIPDSERNVIVSVRYYLPYEFTHQGAHWVAGSDAWLGTRWTGTSSEMSTVLSDMKTIKDWSVNNTRPVTIGEYGAIVNADAADRLRWTKYVRTQFESQGFSWSYFDFGVIFKAYDIEKDRWLDGFQDAFFSVNIP